MLNIYILNVDHGDSIIIEQEKNGSKAYGVIDSNIPEGSDPPPALKKLQQLNVDKLSFVALTHPHRDHFLGLPEIIDSLPVENFYSFPIGGLNPENLKKIQKIYRNIIENTDSDYLKKLSYQFVRLLWLVKNKIGLNSWECPVGCDSIIYPQGFSDVDFRVILPHPKEKGFYFQMIEKGDVNISTSQNLNNLSLAFSIKYKGFEIILGGDGTRANWNSNKMTLARGNKKLNGDIVKLPHHGSRIDCSDDVFEYIFNNSSKTKIACVSANGRSHPDSAIFKYIQDNNILPYCTNLAELCRANIKQLSYSDDIDPALNRLINLYEDHMGSAIQPCQGDIMISIADESDVNITTEYQNACIFRGSYDFLIA